MSPSDQPDTHDQTRGLDHEQLGRGPSALDNHSLEEVRAIARAAGIEDVDAKTKDQLIARLNPRTQTTSGEPGKGNPSPPPAAPANEQAERPPRPSF